MSKIGNYRVGLMERDEYHDGVQAAAMGLARDHHPWPMFSVEAKAFELGWDDAWDEARPRIEP